MPDLDPFLLAERLANLPTPARSEEAGLQTFLFGAIYAAAQAAGHGYQPGEKSPDRWKQTTAKIKDLAGAMGASCTLPVESDWLPGFFANDALLRIDVGFERVLRFVTGKGDGNIDLLQCLGEKHGFPADLLSTWRSIRKRVNTLKHRNPLQLEQERIPYKELLRAVEHLLRGVEWAVTRSNARGA